MRPRSLIRTAVSVLGVTLVLAALSPSASARYGNVIDLSLGGSAGKAVGAGTFDRHVGKTRRCDLRSGTDSVRIIIRGA